MYGLYRRLNDSQFRTQGASAFFLPADSDVACALPLGYLKRAALMLYQITIFGAHLFKLISGRP